MKKMLLLSLVTALSVATFSATISVTAQLNVVDLGAEVSLNLSSLSAAFGNVLIKSGEVVVPTPITLSLAGSQAKNAHIAVPETIELVSGDNKITVATMLSAMGNGVTSYRHNGYTILQSDEVMGDLDTGTIIQGKLEPKMTLAGTEVPGRYNGTISVYAFYN